MVFTLFCTNRLGPGTKNQNPEQVYCGLYRACILQRSTSGKKVSFFSIAVLLLQGLRGPLLSPRECGDPLPAADRGLFFSCIFAQASCSSCNPAGGCASRRGCMVWMGAGVGWKAAAEVVAGRRRDSWPVVVVAK